MISDVSALKTITKVCDLKQGDFIHSVAAFKTADGKTIFMAGLRERLVKIWNSDGVCFQTLKDFPDMALRRLDSNRSVRGVAAFTETNGKTLFMTASYNAAAKI